MQQHFVEFFSPGTFVSECNTMQIDAWDVEKAKELARGVTQRYNARPYGFRFITRSRADDELDSKITAKSGVYYLGGKIETLADVEARNDPTERTLRDNMRINNIGRVIVNTNSWRFTGPFNDDDVLLDWQPEKEAMKDGLGITEPA